LLACLCLTLWACSNQPRLQQTLDWQASGKIGIQQSQGQSGSLSFIWQQSGEHYLIHAFNPIGQLQFSLSGDKHTASYQQADGQRIDAATPEQLLQQMTQWSFPVSAVALWINSEMSGNEQLLEYDAQQRLSHFVIDNWQVSWHYKGHDTQAYKIRLQSNSATLTLIIKNYERFDQL
jgi:outer membrane lipoprotein LolB